MANHFKQSEINGLEILVVVSEDANGAEPTLEWCNQYAEAHGIPPERMVIDPGFSSFFSKVDSLSGGGIGLPWDGVLNARDMTYHWGITSEGSPEAAVEELLNQDGFE